jgi:hypothetical protein
MTATVKVKSGIAEYLSLFDRSPYRLPSSDLVRVEGVSTLKGSWHAVQSCLSRDREGQL